MIIYDIKTGSLTYADDSYSDSGTADIISECTYTVTVYCCDDYCESEKNFDNERDLFLSITRWLENRFGIVFTYSNFWPVLLYYKIYNDSYFFENTCLDKTPEQESSGFG